MTKHVVTLGDKFVQPHGEVMLTTLQGVVRLLLDQSRRDTAAGLNTAGYVSGYRGSPITTLDAQLWSAEKLLKEHHIRFEPGLNEELAATSLRGTQQLDWYGKARVDGVFALWYAKGVGVERAGEAIKAANFEGTHAKGGALLLCGDDHAAKSSLTAHQSEHVLVTAMTPVLYPATTDEMLAFGQYGWALSRVSGLYVGMKAITDTLDLTSTVALPGHAFPIALPELPAGPAPNLRIGMSALAQEEAVIEQRLPIVPRFTALNPIDRVSHDAPSRKLTIVTAGKAWLDVCQALADLGLDAADCARIGLRVVKLGLVWPLDAAFVRDACGGSAEVLVVEEKRAFIEEQLARIFYGTANAPALSGKTAPDGTTLLSEIGVLDSAAVRHALVARLKAHGLMTEEIAVRDAALCAMEESAAELSVTAVRPAYFCSGCPHNTSTIVPEGSAAMGATGCHGLAHYMPERNTMQTVSMGQEGMPWLGAQSYVDTPHMFQNLGDGTYTHSGLLTIRAAVAAKSRVTFKILYNDAVAMTGGQPAEGAMTPEQIVRELVTEGVHPVVLVSEDPARFRKSELPTGVRVLHRDELDGVQRELREVDGTSAIVYEQVCANEKRRRRKRGLYPDPDERLFINQSVCEGCGDCSIQSNCLSIEPVETEFGRKRRINQSSCNKDFSCIKGFCPSFVTITGAKPAKRAIDMSALKARVARLPQPQVTPSHEGHNMLVTGIGGTGVLTVGAVLAMAAHLEGKSAKVLDMTGMAQKGGAVISHLRVAENISAIPAARLGIGQADVIVACDLVVATAPDVLKAAKDTTRLVANEDVAPTSEFQTDQAVDFSAFRFLSVLGKRIDASRTERTPAGELATRLLGDAIFTNFLMVGFAAQKGLLPVSLESIEEAVRLNGVAVKANLDAVALGRLAAADPNFLRDFAGLGEDKPLRPQTYEEMLASRAAHLEAYQDRAYADRYLADMAAIYEKVRQASVCNAEGFLIEAADQLARLMAYKDEYEVARLFTRPEFARSIAEAFEGSPQLSFNLAPPLLPLGRDRKTGRPRKIRLGSWMVPVFRVLAKGRRLRGGVLDLFGYTAERRMERALIDEYRTLVLRLAESLTDETDAQAQEIAASVAQVRGYGPVKEANLAAWHASLGSALARFGRGGDPVTEGRQPAFASSGE